MTVVRVTPEMIAEWLFKGLDVEIASCPNEVVPDGYTMKDLAQLVATENTSAGIKFVVGRIEHWAMVGLFDVAGVDIGPKVLGRGRVRRYSEGGVAWCVLWNGLADCGLGVGPMIMVTHAIRNKMTEEVL